MSEGKIGERALERFARQGLKEVAQVIPAFKDSVQVVEEPSILPRQEPDREPREGTEPGRRKDRDRGQDADLG